MDFRVISIGTLSRNEFWGETAAVRTPHATTTLVRSGRHLILVDPGLPAQVVSARLRERAGIEPAQVTAVFLTNFRPAHRWGLEAFPDATWLISHAEREATGVYLVEAFQSATDAAAREALHHDIAILKRFHAAPDKLADHVDLFPLPGYTPGTCGLLLSHAGYTTLIAGDGVPTVEHLERGQVLHGCYSLEQAKESLLEAIEIADAIVPGHDNYVLNPTRPRM